MRVLIITNLFGNNRQGFDLAGVLRRAGHQVRLVQFAKGNGPHENDYGVGYVNPRGAFSKFHVLRNLFRIAVRSVFWRHDVVVCIGRPLLPIAVVCKIGCQSKLVYYALEYVAYHGVSSYIVRHCVDRWIDVEHNRLKRTMEDLGLDIPSLVINNFPSYVEGSPTRGCLRSYLATKFGFKGHEKILIYAGSYQRYAQLENIVAASELMPEDVRVVLMVAWGLPDRLRKECSKCVFVPPQQGEAFFDWLSDADCALLPYEDEKDFNVKCCSPQKLFDCFRVGVPFLGSRRPIIEAVLKNCSLAGILCDFTSVKSICDAATAAVRLKTPECYSVMTELYRTRYNYDLYSNDLRGFVCE